MAGDWACHRGGYGYTVLQLVRALLCVQPMHTSGRAALAALSLSFVLSASSTALARTAEDRLVGKVSLSRAALPGKTGDRDFAHALAKSARGRAIFWEDAASQSWKIHYATVLKRPTRDVTISIFDVTRGRRLVGTRDKMLYKESRVVKGALTVSRREVFDANARMLMVIESGGRVVGTRTFYIQGKAPRTRVAKNRKVSFEAEDTAVVEQVDLTAVRSKRRAP